MHDDHEALREHTRQNLLSYWQPNLQALTDVHDAVAFCHAVIEDALG